MIWAASAVLGAAWAWAFGVDRDGIAVTAALWVPWAMAEHAFAPAMAGVAGAVVLRLAANRRHKRSDPAGHRADFVRFWRLTGLLLTAGLGLWQAVEAAAEAVPGITGAVRQLAEHLTRERNGMRAIGQFCRAHPGPEAETVATMIDYGFRHGISGPDVLRQAAELADQLGFEQDLRRRRGPVWLSVLPALMLFNMLIVFALPMGMAMVAEWRGVL